MIRIHNREIETLEIDEQVVFVFRSRLGLLIYFFDLPEGDLIKPVYPWQFTEFVFLDELL